MDEVLNLLIDDAKLTPKDIAVMLGKDEREIAEHIKKLEENKVILGYNTIVNNQNEDHKMVVAFIEVRINPEKKLGFDSFAKKLYQYPQVRSLYLMSGGYDFLIEVQGQDLQEVAFFISERLATIGKVTQTSTHFLLKKYKENGIIMFEDNENERLAVSP